MHDRPGLGIVELDDFLVDACAIGAIVVGHAHHHLGPRRSRVRLRRTCAGDIDLVSYFHAPGPQGMRVNQPGTIADAGNRTLPCDQERVKATSRQAHATPPRPSLPLQGMEQGQQRFGTPPPAPYNARLCAYTYAPSPCAPITSPR